MLDVVGISARGQRVYEALILHSPSGPEELAEHAEGRLTVPEIERALSELVDAGLVTRTAGERTAYVPSPPEPAIEAMVLRRQGELARARAYASQIATRLRAATERDDIAGLLEVLVGAESISNRFEQLQRAATHEVLMFDRPPYPESGYDVNSLQMQRMGQGVEYRVAYDRTLADDPRHVERLRLAVEAGEVARLGEVPLKLAIGDRDVALLLLSFDDPEKEPAAVVVRPSVLLDSLVVLFETVWRQCAPFRLDLDPTSDLGPDERELLALLSAGMKDEAIAHQLDVSVRTVRRRLRGLLDRLGVQTRFQAGAAAARRGWI